VLEEFVTEF